MNTALWIVQGLLAFAFFAAGAMKATQPLEKLAVNMAWVKTTPAPLVRFIGIAEIAGAIGLIAPMALGILPILTPVAAVCLVVVMVLAVATHVRLNEIALSVPSIVLGALAAFVAWGRF